MQLTDYKHKEPSEYNRFLPIERHLAIHTYRKFMDDGMTYHPEIHEIVEDRVLCAGIGRPRKLRMPLAVTDSKEAS